MNRPELRGRQRPPRTEGVSLSVRGTLSLPPRYFALALLALPTLLTLLR